MARAINWSGEVLRSVLPPASLSRERLSAVASKETGLTDWGGENFLAPLDHLLDAFESEADLSLVGHLAVRSTLVRLLSHRLKIQRDLSLEPQILDAPVTKPLFVLGLPRTGTTLLHRLLAQGAGARALMWWELLRPSPPPEATGRETDPRVAEADRMARQTLWLIPQMRMMHTTRATTLEECYMLFQFAFSTVFFGLLYRVPSYSQWLLQQEMEPAYRYYRSVLQLLQWRTPANPWILKSPHHLFHLDALLAVFPDACVVHLHRDATKAVASTCSLMTAYRQINCRSFDRAELGRSVLEDLAVGVNRAMEMRRDTEPTCFLDVDYHDLIADPKGQVRKICDHFGYAIDERMDHNMDQWLNRNRQHKYGVHRYSLEEFGLTAAEVRERMDGYLREYDLKGPDAAMT